MRCAAGSSESGEIGLHRFFFSEDGEGFTKNSGGAGMRGLDDSVVHPFTLAAGSHDAGTAQVGKVARDFRLTLPEYLDEMADADLAVAYKVEQPQAGAIGERGKQERQVEVLRGAIHTVMIYALTDMSSGEYIRFSVYEVRRRWRPKPVFRNR